MATNSPAPTRCNTVRIRCVAKNRSATMPTKNGATIAPIGEVA